MERSTRNLPLSREPQASPDLEALVRAGLQELALGTDPDTVGRLADLAALLERWSRQIGLTAHRSAPQIVRRLVLDAAALSKLLPEGESLADVGSGAGFPALPLAILRPACTITSIESRQRPHHFQREAIRRLGLANVQPLCGRAEELAPSPHAAVIAQAAAKPAVAIRWLLRWSSPGAVLLLPGAGTSPEVPDLPELSRIDRHRYRVPLGGPERTLWLARRSLE